MFGETIPLSFQTCQVFRDGVLVIVVIISTGLSLAGAEREP